MSRGGGAAPLELADLLVDPDGVLIDIGED